MLVATNAEMPIPTKARISIIISKIHSMKKQSNIICSDHLIIHKQVS
jgi:hypothetical protein